MRQWINSEASDKVAIILNIAGGEPVDLMFNFMGFMLIRHAIKESVQVGMEGGG